MAFTSPKMGLNIWNLLSDPYDHAQLADNFSKLDLHDHTPGRGIQIPTEGIAPGAITAAKLATGLDPTLYWSTYKPVQSRVTPFGAGVGPADYLVPNASTINPSSAPANAQNVAFYLDPADYSVPGGTTKLRVRGGLVINAVAPAANFTYSLMPVNTWGGTSGNVPTVATVGAAVAGSSVAINAPVATASAAVSSDFSFPTAGWYVLNINISITVASNARSLGLIELHVRQN